jgi:hypothetical protein
MLQVGLDGFVLFVELGEIGNDIFYDVGVREGVDFCFGFGVGWDAACLSVSTSSIATQTNTNLWNDCERICGGV